MTVLATLLVIAAFAYLIHRFAPLRPTEVFRLERFHAPGPLTDRSPSYYENQRQYADLAAIYGRDNVPEADAPSRIPTGPRGAGSRTRAAGR